jgi:Anti-sigma-K factor rskA/Putative zinc-finger
MDSHEEFRELSAAATAGELSADEQARLDAHLAACAECRRVYREFELAAIKGAGALAGVHGLTHEESLDPSWSVEKAEAAFFKRLDEEERESRINVVGKDVPDHAATGKRFTYRPSQIRWREIWMSFAAAILLALALGVAAYKSGVRRGADVAQTHPQPAKESEVSLEARVSDAGYERSQLQGKLAADVKVIEDLKLQLAEQLRIVNSLKSMETVAAHKAEDNQQPTKGEVDAKDRRDEELTAAQARLTELQKTVDVAAAQRDENARQAAVLEAKVNELTALVREREQALDRTESEVTKGQELLEHDRDIRELMGARDLYMADVHDVSGKGTEKTYGRVFYTKGKRLIFYAFDLDAQPGVQNARSFQAWGRRGPDKQQARSLGIFYEDNVSKKRWVLKADDPQSLEDIDAVFVTVEPNGGSQHPSGKQLLFAYLRVNPNHP